IHYNKGVTLYNQQRYDEAIEQLDIATKIYPQFDIAYYNLGLVYLNTGHNDEAIKSFLRVSELAPDTVLANDAKQLVSKLTKKNE
ncbi:MAG: tetratricopeptide repeat protein, partial [Candidatus Brocadiales bacterium]|nr:tetratricopeptide repeat protein [Candidatus Brocadiales bacterium]